MEKLILECVVRSLLLALCTAAVLFVLRVKAARVRHAVWASVVVLMLVMPVWTTWGPKAVLRILTPAPVVVNVQPVVVQQTATEQDAPGLPVHRPEWTWADSLLALYLLGFGALIVRLVFGTVRTRMLMRRAGNRNGRLTSDACVTPITVGLLRPSVILPAGWMKWSREQLNAVLAHEDEHARRRDPLVQWLALLNRAVFWFHPLSWWLERRLSGLAEEACDDAVLMRGHDPLQYSEYLLGLARVVQESGARVAVVGMAMPGTFLPARIRRIVEGADMQRISRGRLISMATVCAAVSTVFTVGAVGYSAPAGRTEVAQETPAPIEVVPPLLYSRGSVGVVAVSKKKVKVLMAQATVPPSAPPAAPAPATSDCGTTNQCLFGVVTDPSGAVVANGPVTLTNTETKATRTANTGPTGIYRFLGVEPGTFSVTARVPGFRTSVQTGISVSPGDAHNVGTMPLLLGNVADSISITGSRSAAIIAAATVGNPLGPVTTIAPKPGPPVGIPLDQKTQGAAIEQLKTLANAYQQQYQANSGKPVRVGGMVQPAKLVAAIKPVYPPDMQRAGVQGTVKFEAVISKDGLPRDIRLINGPDGLTQSALDAVSQWRYEPSKLNGEPVEVLTTIDVNFSLAN